FADTQYPLANFVQDVAARIVIDNDVAWPWRNGELKATISGGRLNTLPAGDDALKRRAVVGGLRGILNNGIGNRPARPRGQDFAADENAAGEHDIDLLNVVAVFPADVFRRASIEIGSA